MKKSIKRNDREVFFSYGAARFECSVENLKRHRALDPLDGDTQNFFNRVLNVKKIREFVFITKANAKSR